MKLIFASDSFKGTISSERAAELLSKAAREVFGNCETRNVLIADGGEGTTDAVIRARNGERIYVTVHGPLMEPLRTYFGKLSGSEAVLEMARASGLPLVPKEKRNPLITTTFGTGEMVKAALDMGFRDISIAIGGSATNDGGMGFARALGVRFLDSDGNSLEGCGRDLEKVFRIDMSGLDARVKETRFTVMCDVTNPLCGKNGAARTFGPQKGASPEIVERLERGMRNYRDVIVRTFGVNPEDIPGSGAAGGLGAALAVFFGAAMQSGIETVLNIIQFDDILKEAGLVVTGEGRADRQSGCGKVLQGVGDRARAHGVPAVAIVGSLGPGYECVYEHGIESVLPAVDSPMSLDEALARAEELYEKAALRLFRLVKVGMGLHGK